MILLRKIFLLLSIIILCDFSSYSQSNIGENGFVIAGKVFNKTNKEPVPFASVFLGDTRRGTICDSLGFFKMTVYVKKNIKISALGFHDKIVLAEMFGDDDKIFLNVDLLAASIVLDQVDIYNPGNWQQFKNAVLESKLKEKSKNLKSIDKSINKMKPEGQSASFGIGINNNKETRKLNKLKAKDFKANLVNSKLTRNYVGMLTEENGVRLDSLMVKINRENSFSRHTSEYMMGIIVLQYHKDFLESHPKPNVK